MNAVREVREESAQWGDIEETGRYHYCIYQRRDTKCRSRSTYLMSMRAAHLHHDFEVDGAEWFTLDEALRKISFKGDRRLLETAKAKLTAA